MIITKNNQLKPLEIDLGNSVYCKALIQRNLLSLRKNSGSLVVTSAWPHAMDALLWAGIARNMDLSLPLAPSYSAVVSPHGVWRVNSLSASPTLLVSGCSNFILGWADMDKKTGVPFQFPCVK